MPLNYITVQTKDLGAGEDSLSAPTSIPEGFSERLTNVDPTPEGYLRKRTGTQTTGGRLPMRVYQLLDNRKRLVFHPDVNLSRQGTTPIAIRGWTGSAWQTLYRLAYTTDPRILFADGITSVPSALTNISTGLASVVLLQQNDGSPDASVVWPDEYSIDSLSNNLSFDLELASPTKALAVHSAKTAGENCYVGTPIGSWALGYEVPAITHSLGTNQLLVEVYFESGTERTFVTPDVVSISTSGDVAIQFVRDDVPAGTPQVVLTPVENEERFSVGAQGELTSSFTATSQYVIPQAYLVEPNGSRHRVEIESFTVNQNTLEATAVVINGGDAVELSIVWEDGQVTTNALTLDQSLPNDLTEAFVWGLNQNICWEAADDESRGGWATFLDVYRAAGEEYPVAGIDSFLCRPDFPSVIYPKGELPLTDGLALRARSLLTANQKIGPLFIEEGSTSTASRWISATGGGSGWLRATLSLKTATPGEVQVTVPLGTSALSPSFDEADLVGLFLTVDKASWRRHAGTHEILAAAFDGPDLVLTVANDAVQTDAFDGAGASVGVFSARLTVPDAISNFQPGDLLSGGYDVRTVTTGQLVVTGVFAEAELAGGSRLYVTSRPNASVVPLRKLGGDESASLDSLVVGDDLSIVGHNQGFHVVDVNAGPTATGTLTDGVLAFAGAAAQGIRVGQRVLLAGPVSGEYVVTAREVTGGTSSLTFEALAEKSAANVALVGYTATLDRAIDLQDRAAGGYALRLQPRWLPLASPKPGTQPFSDGREFGRSSMVTDSLFVATPNVTTPVLKWDGSLLTRAGIPRWNPTVFVSVDTATPGIVLANTGVVTGIENTHVGNKFKLSSGSAYQTFPVGTYVKDQLENEYRVTGYSNVPSDDYWILLDRDVVQAATSLNYSTRFAYYYRLRSIDANNYQTSSAPFGFQDVRVKLATSATVRHRLRIPPELSLLSRESGRLILDVFRTKSGTEAPYYLVASQDLADVSGYVDVADTKSDDTLVDKDAISTGLLGAELGTAWESVPQASCLTTGGNRLVAGNIRSEPNLSLTFDRKTAEQGSVEAADVVGTRFALTASGATQTYEFVTGAGTAIVTSPTPTTFTTGQWYYLFRSDGVKDPKFSGWFKGESISLAGHDSAKHADRYVQATVTTHIPVYLGTDGNYESLGDHTYSFPLAIVRLAAAIRATTTLGIRAEAGDTLEAGQLVLRSDAAFSLTLTPAASWTSKVAVLDRGVPTSATTLGADVQLMPSRLVVSYPNYPGIFDDPFNPLDRLSPSAIDVNPSDGQEITAIQPFFGDSAFGQGNKAAVLVVFKTASVYIVDLDAKASGQPAVQKLDSQGLGCEFPRSVASTRYGLMFANRAGLWKVGQDLRILPIGRRYSGRWKEELLPAVTYADIPCAHNDRQDGKYTLTVDGNQTAVYNHSREYQADGYRDGSWTTYVGYPALGMANSTTNRFMASEKGRVLLRLLDESEAPFRDAGEAILAEATLRPSDFGDQSMRKTVLSFHLTFDTEEGMAGTAVLTATDLKDKWSAADQLVVAAPSEDGLSDEGRQRAQTFRFSSRERRGVYYQVRLVNGKLDEGFRLLSASYRVAGLSERGTKSAGETGK